VIGPAGALADQLARLAQLLGLARCLLARLAIDAGRAGIESLLRVGRTLACLLALEQPFLRRAEAGGQPNAARTDPASRPRS
jgi:hypothetical protein